MDKKTANKTMEKIIRLRHAGKVPIDIKAEMDGKEVFITDAIKTEGAVHFFFRWANEGGEVGQPRSYPHFTF